MGIIRFVKIAFLCVFAYLAYEAAFVWLNKTAFTLYMICLLLFSLIEFPVNTGNTSREKKIKVKHLPKPPKLPLTQDELLEYVKEWCKKNKSEFVTIIHFIDNIFLITIRDNGKPKEFGEFLDSLGIIHGPTCPMLPGELDTYITPTPETIIEIKNPYYMLDKSK